VKIDEQAQLAVCRFKLGFEIALIVVINGPVDRPNSPSTSSYRETSAASAFFLPRRI
jgi:hypothetical protein